MKIRTTKPEKGNKYFIREKDGGYSSCIKGNPTDKDCNVLANCVGYAVGAFNEQLGKGKEVYNLSCNAENFIEKAIKLGLSVVKEPVVGGIMVWQKGATLKKEDGCGHVAICTKIIDKNTVKTAESAYKGKAFYTSTRSNKNGRWGSGSAYKYRGCIVCPTEVKVEPKTSTTFKVGDKVVPINLVNYNGAKLKQYDKYYYIKEINNDRVVLVAKRNNKNYVWAALNINNIKKI